MKIAVVWWWDKASKIFDDWRDGHRAAIEIVAKKHELEWFLDKKIPDPGKFDFLLFWSSSIEDYFDLLDNYKTEKKGLCLTTDITDSNNLRKMDIIFVESDPIVKQCRGYGLPVIKAFGTDTSYFKPDKSVEKDIEYFYPATFSPWKRQRDIAHLGGKLLCVGTVQPDGREDYEICKENNVRIEEGYFPVEKILNYYQRSKHVIIPAVHGSERTVLESMSCDILPFMVNADINVRTNSYLKEYREFGYKSPRRFVEKFYSHRLFAKNLLNGIERCVKSQ